MSGYNGKTRISGGGSAGSFRYGGGCAKSKLILKEWTDDKWAPR